VIISSYAEVAKVDVNNFEVIRTCNSGYETKIQEALLIKKYNLQLNKQLYAKGIFFFVKCVLMF